MTYLVISDLHGAAEQLDLLSRREREFDALLMNGDMTHFGGGKQAAPLLDVLAEMSPLTVAVHGNCDRASVADLLRERGLGRDGAIDRRGPLPVLTLGGSLPAPVPTPSTWSEEEAQQILSGVEPPEKPWIFVCHQPPAESEADRIASGAHVGSAAVADFIRRTAPALVCTGHIHEAFSVSRFADSLLVNPGSLKEGRYALVKEKDGEFSAELRRL